MSFISSVLAQVKGGGSIKLGDKELELDCEEKEAKLECKYKWKAGSSTEVEAPVPEQPPAEETEPAGSGDWFDRDETCPEDGNPYCDSDVPPVETTKRKPQSAYLLDDRGKKAILDYVRGRQDYYPECYVTYRKGPSTYYADSDAYYASLHSWRDPLHYFPKQHSPH